MLEGGSWKAGRIIAKEKDKMEDRQFESKATAPSFEGNQHSSLQN